LFLRSALTLEWLESTFYQQGFAKFPASDFLQLGLTQTQVDDLLQVGQTEQEHVVLLQSAIAAAGVQPVQPCNYSFGFTDAKGMVGTAAVLENVGVSAYLGAGPILSSPTILGTAASILTVESRHQTFVRAATGVAAVPQAFDTALSPKQVFSLAMPFIQSCPEGSNLVLTAFPTITMGAGASASTDLVAGQSLALSSSASGASFCGFTTGLSTTFAPFSNGACQVPENLQGVTYVTLTSQGPLTGALTDDIIVAGPMVMVAS
jgi:hypothetical protein